MKRPIETVIVTDLAARAEQARHVVVPTSDPMECAPWRGPLVIEEPHPPIVIQDGPTCDTRWPTVASLDTDA